MSSPFIYGATYEVIKPPQKDFVRNELVIFCAYSYGAYDDIEFFTFYKSDGTGCGWASQGPERNTDWGSYFKQKAAPPSMLKSIESNDIPTVQSFIESHQTPAKTGYLRLAYQRASDLGKAEIIEMFWKNNLYNDYNKQKVRLIYDAALHGHLECVELAAKHGVPVDTVDTSNQTPLFHAACRGHESIVKYLLVKGANPLHEVRNGKTIISMTKTFKQDLCAAILEKAAQEKL